MSVVVCLFNELVKGTNQVIKYGLLNHFNLLNINFCAFRWYHQTTKCITLREGICNVRSIITMNSNVNEHHTSCLSMKNETNQNK